jgi:hypothetical protein
MSAIAGIRVARMEARSAAIRVGVRQHPDSASLHPGYERVFR